MTTLFQPIKIAFLFAFCILFSVSVFSQSFFETSWVYDGVTYTALYLYEDDAEGTMRVYYKNGGQYIVSEFSCVVHQFEDEDLGSGFLVDGNDAKIVFPLDYHESSYSPDNFVLLSTSDGLRVFTIDNNGLEEGSGDYIEVEYWKEVSTSELTEDYLYSFFEKEESIFSALLTFTEDDDSDGVLNNEDECPNEPGVASNDGCPIPEPEDEKPVMHLIIVADTYDYDIGNHCEEDKDNIKKTFDFISHTLGLDLEIKEIFGKQFSKEKVKAAIRRLRPADNDIVIFYYAGHGFRFPDQNSEYPNILLASNNGNTKHGLSLEKIHTDIVDKGARLNMIIADCCNNVIGETNRNCESSPISKRSSSGSSNIEILKKLFIESEGSCIVASASEGETSCGGDKGGIFTRSLIKNIVRVSGIYNDSSEDPSWNDILVKSKKNAVEINRNQGCNCEANAIIETNIE